MHHGALALTTALRLSTLLPSEQDAIFSILRSLNTADEPFRRDPSSNADQANVLASVLDTYRRALAELGR